MPTKNVNISAFDSRLEEGKIVMMMESSCWESVPQSRSPW